MVLGAQTPPPAPLDWSSDDSARVAFLTANGRAYTRPQVIVWAPLDSLDAKWLAAFVDSLAAGLDSMRRLIGAHAWQRIGRGPVTYYLSPGRFVSHGSGVGAVFISLTRVRDRKAPYLHEAAHELLATLTPFFPFEYGDSIAAERAAAGFPYWLSEGLPDYLAQQAAGAAGFHEGDVFDIGGLAKVDSTCAARLAASPRREEILERVGRTGSLEALFTTDRPQVAPVFYACSQSFTKYVVDRVGIRAVVASIPSVPAGTWPAELEAAAGTSLEALRSAWLAAISPALAAPNQADSTPAAAQLAGQALANQQSMDARLAGGLVSGFFFSLIGTGIAWAVASGDPTPLPEAQAFKVIDASPSYQEAFKQGYSARLTSRRKRTAVTGGLIGTAIGAVVIVLAAQGN
jgi:hypothetical protein